MKLRRRKRAEEEPARLSKLSDREKQILQLFSQGRRVPEISRKLWITQATVEAHLRNIFRSLSQETRTACGEGGGLGRSYHDIYKYGKSK